MLIWKTHQVVLLRGHKNFHKYCAPRVVSLAPIHWQRSISLYWQTTSLKIVARLMKNYMRLLRRKSNNGGSTMIRKWQRSIVMKTLLGCCCLLVDGCATLQFIDSVVHEKVKDFKIKNDQVAFVQQDLFLLENQLPYQLLDNLMKNLRFH